MSDEKESASGLLLELYEEYLAVLESPYCQCPENTELTDRIKRRLNILPCAESLCKHNSGNNTCNKPYLNNWKNCQVQ